MLAIKSFMTMGDKTIGLMIVGTFSVENRVERLLLKILKSLGLECTTIESISS
jgi:hypothetical protein